MECATFRAFSRIALLTLAALALPAAAQKTATAPACHSGVCVVNITSEKLLAAPCADASVLVAWAEKSGATAILCTWPQEDDNRAYLYARGAGDGAGYEIDAARLLRPNALADLAANGVPTRMGTVPLCKAALPADATGQLILIQQNDAGAGPQGPCYRAYFATEGQGKLAVQSSPAPKASELAVRDEAQWKQLRALLEANIAGLQSKPAMAEMAAPGSAAVASERKVKVTVAKAKLYAAPQQSAPSRMYLVKGDEAVVLDASKSSAGWLRLRYHAAGGKCVERWVRATDVADAAGN